MIGSIVGLAAFAALVAGYVLGRSTRRDAELEYRARLASAVRAEQRLRDQLANAEQDFRHLLADVRGLGDRMGQGLLPVVAERAVLDILARHEPEDDQ